MNSKPGTPVYNMPYSLRVRGDLDKSALEKSLASLIQKHEALRTVFKVKDKQPYQHIQDSIATPIEFETIGNAQNTNLKEILRKYARQSFDLAAGPLFKLHVLETAQNDHMLLLVIHHIISDLWSLDVFFKDLSNCYLQHTSDTRNFPELTIQYADYAAWQRELLSGPRLEQQLSFWRRTLRGAPEHLGNPHRLCATKRAWIPRKMGCEGAFTLTVESNARACSDTQLHAFYAELCDFQLATTSL